LPIERDCKPYQLSGLVQIFWRDSIALSQTDFIANYSFKSHSSKALHSIQ